MRVACLCLALLVLSSCTLRRPPPEWDARQQAVLQLEDWAFSGRMAVKSEAPDASGGQLSVRWQQTADTSRIRLSGPLGAGAWQLVWTPESIVVTDNKGERSAAYTGPDAAEQFMQAELGWAFPADSLRYWVRGVPDPTAVSRERFDEDGRLTAIEQHGWQVEIDRYRDADGLELPARLTVQGRDVRLRIAIASWDI